MPASEHEGEEQRLERWAEDEHERASEAWRKVRDDWLDRAMKLSIGLHAGGATAVVALIGSRLQSTVPWQSLAAAAAFAAGLVVAAALLIIEYLRASREVTRYENIEAERVEGLPLYVNIDGRQDKPQDAALYCNLTRGLVALFVTFIVGLVFAGWGLVVVVWPILR